MTNRWFWETNDTSFAPYDSHNAEIIEAAWQRDDPDVSFLF